MTLKLFKVKIDSRIATQPTILQNVSNNSNQHVNITTWPFTQCNSKHHFQLIRVQHSLRAVCRTIGPRHICIYTFLYTYTVCRAWSYKSFIVRPSVMTPINYYSRIFFQCQIVCLIWFAVQFWSTVDHCEHGVTNKKKGLTVFVSTCNKVISKKSKRRWKLCLVRWEMKSNDVL